MNDDLIPLDVPPGIRHQGTAYQSKGRWYHGNGVRFSQGATQPIGGWVQRTVTGAAIVGTPNCAHAWQTNDGASYLAIGTTTNLYIVTTGNIVYDITPTAILSDGLTHVWQMDNFGAYLVACFNAGQSSSVPMNAYYWNATIGTVAAQLTTSFAAPSSVYGIFTTPERFLMILRGADTGSLPSGVFTPIANRVD